MPRFCASGSSKLNYRKQDARDDQQRETAGRTLKEKRRISRAEYQRLRRGGTNDFGVESRDSGRGGGDPHLRGAQHGNRNLTPDPFPKGKGKLREGELIPPSLQGRGRGLGYLPEDIVNVATDPGPPIKPLQGSTIKPVLQAEPLEGTTFRLCSWLPVLKFCRFVVATSVSPSCDDRGLAVCLLWPLPSRTRLVGCSAFA